MVGCGACGRRRDEENSVKYDVMGGYKYLTERQINARLEVFKKKYCKDCEDRYSCNFGTYSACTKK